MAVTEIIETHSGRRGRDDVRGVREYERVFTVITDSAYDGPKTVKNAFGLPKYNEFYKTTNEEDKEAFLEDKNADQIDESQKVWTVTCTFSTLTNNGNGGLELPVEPLNQTSTLEWGLVEYRELAIWGIDRETDKEAAVTNSAKDPVDGLELDAARLVLKISRYEGSFNPFKAYQYANAVNSDDWYGFPKHTALMKPWRGVYKNQRGQPYWEVTYEIHFDFDTWDLRFLDTGIREFLTQAEADQRNGQIKSYSNGKQKSNYVAGYNWIRNSDGTFVGEPVALDGKGKAAAVPGITKSTELIVPKRRRYGVYSQLPFGPLRLP